MVDYRRINRTIVRAIYYIRRCDDVKSHLIGSVYLSSFDGLKGFNLLKNTPFSTQVWAVLSEIGCLLPQALQLGGANGPFDFQYVVDVIFQPEGGRKRRFGKVWLNYLDDFCIRSGRWLRGGPVLDSVYEKMLRECSEPPEEPRSFGDALDACGFQSIAIDHPRERQAPLSCEAKNGSLSGESNGLLSPGRTVRSCYALKDSRCFPSSGLHSRS